MNTKKAVFIILLGVILLLNTTCFAVTDTALPAENTGDEKVITIGMDDTYAPMEFRDESGVRKGFDIDLANEITKRLECRAEFVSVPWDGIFAALKNKRIDCIISSASVTEERKKVFQCSTPYIEYGQIIITKKANIAVRSKDSLKGKRVGVQSYTDAEELCDSMPKSQKIKVFRYKNADDLITALVNNKVDAVICDELTGRYKVTCNSKLIKVVGSRMGRDQLGIYLNDPDLRARIDKVLADMKKDGTLKRISLKWFGADLTNIKK